MPSDGLHREAAGLERAEQDARGEDPQRPGAAEQGDGDRVESDARRRCPAQKPVVDGAEHLVDAGEADQRAGDQHRVRRTSVLTLMPATRAALRVLADGAEPEAEARPVEQPPDEDASRAIDEDEPEVQVELRRRAAPGAPPSRFIGGRLRVVRPRRLQQARGAQHEEHQVERDVVEHDRDDHLVRAGARLEQAGDARPRAPRRRMPASERDEHVQRRTAGRTTKPTQPAAAAAMSIWPRPPMLNMPDAEAERDAEAGRDERGGEGERLGERPDAR